MRRLLIIPVIGMMLFIMGAKGCDTGSTRTSNKPNRLIAVTLETRGSAARQQIRYKVVKRGEQPSSVGWDVDMPFVGKHYKNTLFLSDGERVFFHAINHDAAGTHVRCQIHAFKSKKADHADPALASCYYKASTVPEEN